MAFSFVRRSQPDRTEVSDESGWAATFTDNSRTVIMRGATRTFTEISAGIIDDFARPSTAGWGSSPNGGKWYSVGGVTSAYFTDAGRGVTQVTSANVAYRTLITNAHKDIDASVRMRTTGDTNRLGVQQGLVFGYSDTNNYHMATMSVVPGNVSDLFNRTVSDGWGVASSGQGWTASGATPTDYEVGDNQGKHKIGVVNSSLRSLITASADFDCTVKVATDALAQGSSILTSILARYQDANNYYMFRIRFSSAPSYRPLYICIQKQQAGTATTLSTEFKTSVNHAPGTFVWIRAQGIGSQLSMKLWPDGASEPADWHVQATDTTFTSGGMAGLRSLVSAGNTNPLPVVVSYKDFSLRQLNTSAGHVKLDVLKRASGVTNTVASVVLQTTQYESGASYWLRVITSGTTIKLRLWEDGQSEPGSWHVQHSGTVAPIGNVGTRSYCSSEAPMLPVTFYYDTYRLQGTWAQPPIVTHNTWVRLLPAAFTGTVDEQWLEDRMADNTVDILAIAMQYLTGVPYVTDENGVTFAGDANYSSLYDDGGRRSGGDFNDYLGIDWRYSATSLNEADPLFITSLDCTGFVRMVFGYRSGYPCGLSASSVKIPRSSYNVAYAAPGTIVASNQSAVPALSALQIGDILYFCKPTGDPNQAESQVDHVGIYLGADTLGRMRFLSSRRAINGPTMADVGGASLINDPGQYGETLRVLRRL